MITRKGDDYVVPATLINLFVGVTLTVLISIGTWMIIWARSDAEWKATMLAQFISLQSQVSKIETKVESGILPLAKQRLDDLERRQTKDELRSK